LKSNRYFFIFAGVAFITWLSAAKPRGFMPSQLDVNLLMSFQDTTKKDTAKKPYKPSPTPTYKATDRQGDPFSNPEAKSPLLLDKPSNVTTKVEMDSVMGTYTIYEKVGDLDYRPVSTMTYEEFSKWKQQEMARDYWRSKSAGLDGESAVTSRNLIPKIYISPAFDRIFGGNYVDIRPNGSVMLDFGGQFQRTANPSLPIRTQRTGTFLFDQQISMNVVGKIGEKLKITANWDTKASFDFENNIRLEYTGFDNEIIQKIEAGNVSLPISSSLITGAQNLFGVKAQMQFGRLSVTSIATTQRGRSDQIEIKGGAQRRNFEIRSSDYEDNRHYFLSHFFRNRYEQWLNNIPMINSGVNISRVEIYVTNRTNSTESLRNIVGFIDLGETERVYNNNFVTQVQQGQAAGNGGNNLYGRVRNDQGIRNAETTNSTLEGGSYNLQKDTDFSFIKSARQLVEGKDFTINKQLGYISLTTPLRNDDVMAVSFEYTYNGKPYKVGELREDYQNLDENATIILKLIRPATIQTRIPTWDLMMKNIYSLNASQISRDNFQLRVIYKDDATGVDNPSLHEGVLKDKPLLRVMSLDRLNPNNELQPDGNFDFVEGITVDTRNGRVIFPVLEPFGEVLAKQYLVANEPLLANKYAYTELYDSTKADAVLNMNKNKFFLSGSLQSSSSNEIMLPGINVARGSVVVTAGNMPLVEGQQYTVDYDLGRVKIIDESVLNSNQEIRIRYEKADMFNFQPRSLFGTRAEYRVNKDFIIGGTLLHLNERPIITRVNIGDEPTKNSIWGLDLNYRRESRLLTKIIDRLPLISTKEISTINFTGEFAQLQPGSSRFLGNRGGVSYIDDFEGSQTPYDISRMPHLWKHAAVPEDPGTNPKFPEAFVPDNDLSYSYRRAKLAWYSIDDLFYREVGRGRPNYIHKDSDFLKNHYVRMIGPQEIFRERSLQAQNIRQYTFDLAYFPTERGPYNFNPDINADGKLAGDPRQNWAGITRAINNSDTDFDNANIQYIEFWLMDPFIGGNHGSVDVNSSKHPANTTGGQLFFNLGSISEDVIKDNQHAFENGLPTPNQPAETRENAWGRVTAQQYLTKSFDNTSGARAAQDVGLNGLNSAEEREYQAYREQFLDKLPAVLSDSVRNAILADPAGDDFQFYLGKELDEKTASILERYKNFNNPANNSPESSGDQLFTPSYTTIPDNEDLNNDNTVNKLESYYEYKVDLLPASNPRGLKVGQNYVVDQVDTTVNGDKVTWYQFRIPIRDLNANGARRVGNINDFKSIRFLRMYMTGWEQPVVLRFAQMQMVASQWRRYEQSLTGDQGQFRDEDKSAFHIATVNIEENSVGSESKIPYASPPGVIRDRDNTSIQNRLLNEQSLSLCVNRLNNNDAKAVYKNVSMDFINYGRMQMYVHAQSSDVNTRDDETTVFVRLGTDFTENYYEIEVPLTLTQPNTSDPNEIWMDQNHINITLDELHALKAVRDRSEGGELNRRFPFPAEGKVVEGTKQRVRIMGRPDLSAVRTIMIGIRNPASGMDQEKKSVCVWVNELRVSDFDKHAGWAATGRLSTKLADFATVTATGRYTTVGFGGIEQRISQRSRATVSNFNVSSNVMLDKFVPEKVGLRVPMYVSYETQNIDPQFDPFDPDVPLKASVAAIEDPEQREKYRRITQDNTVRRSINFTNVQKVKTNTNSTPKPYDIENVSLTYAYSDEVNTNYLRELYLYKSYTGAVGYNYAHNPKPIEPFKNIKALDSPYLKLLKETNFSPLPNNIAVRAELNRRFRKEQLRGTNIFEPSNIAPTYEKAFLFNRLYSMRWALTKGLTLDYNANVQALVDEPDGDIEGTKQDTVITNLKNFGRMKNFDQSIAANYRMPLDKFPLTDWVSADLRYAANYIWTAAPLNLADSAGAAFGNTIQNNREQAINGRIDLLKLYNKVKFLNDINNPKPRRRTPPPPVKPLNNKVQPAAKPAEDTVKAPREFRALKIVLRSLMTARSLNFNYSVNEGTMLPDYLPTAEYLGANFNRFNGAPGAAFILGDQDPDIRFRAAREGWLGTSAVQNRPFSQSRNENFTAQTSLEPVKDFRIQLNARKTKTAMYQEIFADSTGSGLHYQSLSPNKSGTFSVSYITIATSFSKLDTQNVSQVFRTFAANRNTMLERLSRENPHEGGDYNLNSQDVLIPAFLAAYSGKDINRSRNSPFPVIPLPNWRIDYAGLNKIGWFKDNFSAINLTHSYTSSYSIGNYTTSLQYNEDPDLFNLNRRPEDYQFPFIANEDSTGRTWVPVYVVGQVAISERFAPLVGVNIRTKSKITIKLDYNRDRNIALNLSNAQITEMSGQDIVVGLGFAKSNLVLPIKSQGRQIVLKNELNFRADFTVRDTRTIQRRLEGTHQVTAGGLDYQFRPTVNYVVNQRLNVQAYFERTINNPRISSSFKRSVTRFGIQLRFSLS
jgi:cell surface protein SprA